MNIRELMLLPIDDSRRFFAALELRRCSMKPRICCSRKSAHASNILATWLGILKSRSPVAHVVGREVQRINLTTALGTSLVNTLFVLDSLDRLHLATSKRIVA